MERNIAKKTQRSRQGSHFDIEDKEGDQWQVTYHEINLSYDSKDENEGGDMRADAGAQGRGGAHPPEPMIAITNAMQSDPSGLMFVRLGFEVETAHHFVFLEMMYGPNNLLQIDGKCVEQLVTVACKPGGGVAGAPVTELAELNFKLLVYYVKLCELRSRPVVLDDIGDNALRSIKYHRNYATIHGNTEKSPPVITQIQITKNIDLVW